MEDFAGRSFHSARWDYGYTGGGPGQPLTELGDQVVGLVGTGATGIQCLPPAGRGGAARLRVPAHALGHRGAGQPRRPRPTSADGLRARAGSRSGWTTSRPSCWAGPADEDLTDDGWTRHYAAVQHPPAPEGHDRSRSTSAAPRRSTSRSWRSTVDGSRSWCTTALAAEVLKPYYRYLCKRPCFHDEYLSAFNEPNVTLVDCPGGIERVTARGPGRRRPAVRRRLPRLRHRLRGRAHAAAPAGRPRDRRARRDHPGREVGRRRGQPVRDDDPRLPQHVRDARPGPAGGRHRQLHPAGGARRRVRRAGGADPRGAGGDRLRRQRPRPRTTGPEEVVDSFVDASQVMAACTPSRLNIEGHPEAMNPRNGNYGRGLGDYFGYRQILRGLARRGPLRGPRARRGHGAVGRGSSDRWPPPRLPASAASRSSPAAAGGIGAAIAEELGPGRRLRRHHGPAGLGRRHRAAADGRGDDRRAHRGRRWRRRGRRRPR